RGDPPRGARAQPGGAAARVPVPSSVPTQNRSDLRARDAAHPPGRARTRHRLPHSAKRARSTPGGGPQPTRERWSGAGRASVKEPGMDILDSYPTRGVPKEEAFSEAENQPRLSRVRDASGAHGLEFTLRPHSQSVFYLLSV